VVFYACASLSIFSSVLALAFLRAPEAGLGSSTSLNSVGASISPPSGAGFIGQGRGSAPSVHVVRDGLVGPSPLVWIITSPRLLLLLALEMCLLLLLDMTTIVPSFLSEVAGLAPSVAARAASACPTGGALAVLVVGCMHDRLTRRTRNAIFTSLLAVSLACVCLLAVPSVVSGHPTRIVVLLFLVGGAMAPVKYLVAPVFCASLGGGQHMATLLSWIDVPGFLVTGFFYRNFHIISRSAGWPGVFHTFAMANAAALVSYVGFCALERGGDLEARKEKSHSPINV
jgi:sugar phosphate permease